MGTDGVQDDESLADAGFRQTESTCQQVGCPGTLWYRQNTLICDQCAASIDVNERRSRGYLGGAWGRFWADRSTYKESNRVRMVGGFLDPYDWVTSDEHDGVVSDLSGQDFYR